MKILLLLLIVLFTPLPLIVTFVYSQNHISVKFFNHNLKTINKFTNFKDTKEKTDTTNTQEKVPNKKHTNTKKIKKKHNFSYKNISKGLSSNRFKPTLRVKGFFTYSLGDYAVTAIVFGIISSIMPFLYRYISNFFKVKNFKFPINTASNENIFFSFNFKCIIFISIAKTIYMLFLIFLSKYKEVSYVKRTSN